MTNIVHCVLAQFQFVTMYVVWSFNKIHSLVTVGKRVPTSWMHSSIYKIFSVTLPCNMHHNLYYKVYWYWFYHVIILLLLESLFNLVTLYHTIYIVLVVTIYLKLSLYLLYYDLILMFLELLFSIVILYHFIYFYVLCLTVHLNNAMICYWMSSHCWSVVPEKRANRLELVQHHYLQGERWHSSKYYWELNLFGSHTSFYVKKLHTKVQEHGNLLFVSK